MKAGFYKVNFLNQETEYKSFYPARLQDIKFDSFDLNTVQLLNEANYYLGKLNGLAGNIKDINQFIGSYVRKEALYSSQIEGTQATLEDILDSNVEENTNADIAEVINSRKGKKRDDLPWIESEADAIELADFVKNFNQKNKPQVVELLNKFQHKNIVILKSREEANNFLNNINELTM